MRTPDGQKRNAEHFQSHMEGRRGLDASKVASVDRKKRSQAAGKCDLPSGLRSTPLLRLIRLGCSPNRNIPRPSGVERCPATCCFSVPPTSRFDSCGSHSEPKRTAEIQCLKRGKSCNRPYKSVCDQAGWFSRRSVQKVAHTGEDHGHAQAISGSDNVVIAHRASWLNHRHCASFRCFFDSIGKRKKRVRRDD